MSAVTTVLGEYMLKGWILTDNICQKCGKGVPLLRSPKRVSPETYLCALCDANPPSELIPSNSGKQIASTSSDSSARDSRPSTPLTEMSSHPSSPEIPPLDVEEYARRRQQSDTASTEIGKLLLKGWAMLADECPNPDCIGIPLVGPPRAGGSRDPRKECVICHNVYTEREDGAGLINITSSSAPKPAASNEDPALHLEAAHASVGRGSKGEDSTPARVSVQIGQVDPPKPRSLATPAVSSSIQNAAVNTQTTLQKLDSTLKRLSEHLDSLTASPVLDVVAIGQTADAMGKVAQAALQLRQL